MFDTLKKNLTLLVARRILKELSAIRGVVEELVDTIRETHRLQPLYRDVPPVVEDPKDYEAFIQPGDHLTYWILEELAAEFKIPVDAHTNLESVAKDRGWVDAEGNLLMLPKTAMAQGITLDGWRAIVRESE